MYQEVNKMKIFIWQTIDKCTSNYHPEGGVVVVAENLERAKELALGSGAEIKEDEKPDAVYDVAQAEEKVFIFPDAGCC